MFGVCMLTQIASDARPPAVRSYKQAQPISREGYIDILEDAPHRLEYPTGQFLSQCP